MGKENFMSYDLKEKLSGLKTNLQQVWDKVSANDFELPKKKIEEATEWVSERRKDAKDRSSQLRTKREDEPTEGVRYYSTENSPLSRGEPKSPGVGIDKFGGEKDEVSPEDLHH
jgi:predicted RNA-binding protein with EMAP domain